MPGKLRIFVSSTMEDLANERAFVVERLRSFNFEPVNAEQMPPDGTSSWDRIVSELDTCHLFVLLLGQRYGWVPQAGPLAELKLSVTHGEYRRAREFAIPVLPFVKRLRYSAEPASEENRRRDAFRSEVEEFTGGQFRGEFDLALDLADRVASSVTAMLSDNFQRTAVQKRVDHASDPKLQGRPAARVRPPEGLVNAIRRGEALPFVGSAIGLAAGLPSSPAFSAQFVRLIREAQPGYEPSTVAGFPSIAADLESIWGRGKLADCARLLLELPGARPTVAHHSLIKLFPQIVTTNYDVLWEAAINHADSGHRVLLGSEPLPLPASFVLKLHGSYTDPDTLVITETDQIEFERTRAELLAEVSRLLHSRILFLVGSSLRDPTVLRLLRARRGSGQKGYCLTTSDDWLTLSRIKALDLEPIVGSIEDFCEALASAAG